MKKRVILLFIISIVLFTNCRNPFQNDIEAEQELTIINNTNQYVKYSIINGTTASTSSADFYSTSHSYLTDIVGTTIVKQLLCPSGTVSDGLLLDRMTYRIKKGKYNVTIFVCKSNTYTNKSDEYINKGYFSISGNKTITIGSNGSIY